MRPSIQLPACPHCFQPLRMSLDTERVPWLECGMCEAVFSSPIEILAYIEENYQPGGDE